jgi:hypothetical protein
MSEKRTRGRQTTRRHIPEDRDLSNLPWEPKMSVNLYRTVRRHIPEDITVRHRPHYNDKLLCLIY